MPRLEELKETESEILTLRAGAKADRFEVLTDALLDVRRQIFAIEPKVQIERNDPETWRLLTELRAGLD